MIELETNNKNENIRDLYRRPSIDGEVILKWVLGRGGLC
jgi:hypothetical protein